MTINTQTSVSEEGTDIKTLFRKIKFLEKRNYVNFIY